MKLKTKIWLGIVMIAVIGLIWYSRSRSGESDAIATERVTRGDVSETVSVTGELVPTTYVDLAFLAIGVIDGVTVSEGDRVRAGQVLATLNRETLQARLNEARKELAIAEAEERLARRQWDDLKPEERKAQTLQVEVTRELIKGIMAEFEEYTLRAPFDGVVTMNVAKVGQTVKTGDIMMRLAGSDTFEIEARVPESDVAKLALGMQADITFDALSSDEVFQGTVSEINSSATVVQDVVSYVTTFALPKGDERLRDGMTADIDISTARREGVLTLPFRALSTADDKTYAERKRADGTTERVEVQTGLEGDEGKVEILSGLQEGDEVVVSAVSK